MSAILENYHMWFVLGVTGVAIYLFAKEKFPIEVTSTIILTSLLLFGQIFELPDANGKNMLSSTALLAGFASPALIAVLALLVMGQAIIRTDLLRPVIQLIVKNRFIPPWLALLTIYFLVMVSSAFLNNTPLVVLTIPIVQAIASSSGMSESKVMMPLSFVAILGGMMTLIGSSTNLLVSSAMVDMGYDALGFFDFIIPGSMMAGVGFLYVVLLLPRLLPDRRSLVESIKGGEKEFVAEIDVEPDSELVGMECVDGGLPGMPDLNIKMIQRAGHLILPPFEGYEIKAGDIMIVAATRNTLAEFLAKYPGFMISKNSGSKADGGESPVAGETGEGKSADATAGNNVQEGEADSEEEEEIKRPAELEATVAETHVLAEIMITPASRMIDMTIDQVDFHRQFGVNVLGIQRRARVVRRRLGRIRLEPGDVLLLAGTQGAVDAMRGGSDLIVLSGSKQELPIPKKAPIAGGIFLATVVAASTGFLSISVAAITGSALLIATGCLNIRQATRAIDRKIFLLIGSMLALGVALQATGGALFVARLLLEAPFADQPLYMVALMYILVAITTNILSNNACAILFTPIAINMSLDMGVDPFVFIVTIIMAANSCFASPIGYKTNLLVMGPGHYRFSDFMKAGIPLVLIMWGAFVLLAKFYFGL